jgi:ankyrin repeat protein
VPELAQGPLGRWADGIVQTTPWLFVQSSVAIVSANNDLSFYILGQILHFAARHGKTAYAGIICSMLGVDVNVEDLEADTPLIACCSGGDDSRDAAALLIQHGANVNHANSDGCSALHYSGRGRHERLVQLLVESGADWNQVNESDDLGEYWTPLCATIEQGNEAAARIMLEGGAYLDGDQSRPPLLSLRNARRCKLSAKGLRCLNALAPDPEAATIEPGHPRVQW